MKKYVSVFEMIARSSIYKVFGIVLGLWVVEGALFALTMTSPSGLNIEEYIDQSHYSLLFKIAYILVTIALVYPGLNIGSKQNYTLGRLQIKELWVFWLQVLYNALAYFILWGGQLLLVFASIGVFAHHLPEGVAWSNQTVFLAFYRSAFMHSILPLEDTSGWWLLGMIGVGTGFLAAIFSRWQRLGRIGFELVVMLVTVQIIFPRALGHDYIFFIIMFLFTLVSVLFRYIWNRSNIE